MDVTIRYAVKNDLVPLTDIYNAAIKMHTCTGDLDEFSYDNRETWLREHLEEKYCCLVAEMDGQIVGYGTLSPYRKNRKALSHVAEVSIYIRVGFTGQGIGTRLLKKLEIAAKERKITILMAYIFKSNKASIALFSKNDFSKWGELPNVIRQINFVTSHVIYGKEVEKFYSVTTDSTSTE